MEKKSYGLKLAGGRDYQKGGIIFHMILSSGKYKTFTMQLCPQQWSRTL